MSDSSHIPAERTYLGFQVPPSGDQRRQNSRYIKSHCTYLGLIAYVIQKSPNRRLTFCQIMDNLEAFVSGHRSGLANNIRVCLSSNDCFTKVPVDAEYPNSKRNFWKVDESRITSKMLRRHFKGMLHHFPELAHRVRRDSETTGKNCKISNASKPSVNHKGYAAKFSGPFSIESILKKDTCSRPCPKPSALHTLRSHSEGDGFDNQHLIPSRAGLGLKRKVSQDELICGPSETTFEFRGQMHKSKNIVFSANSDNGTYSTMGILGVPHTSDPFRPWKRLRMSRDFPTPSVFDSETPFSHFQSALNFNVINLLHYPLSAYKFG